MLDPLTKGYLSQHPAAAARSLQRMEAQDVAALLQVVSRAVAGDLLEHMDPEAAARCLQLVPLPAGAEMLARLPPHLAVRPLRLFPREHAKACLEAMPHATTAQLRLRLRYPETVVGAYLLSEVPTLQAGQRVGDALRLLRRERRMPAHEIFVLDEQRRLVGMVDLADLLSRRDRSPVSLAVQPVPLKLSARTPLQSVAGHPAWLTHDALPVTGRNEVFQGLLPRSAVMHEEQQLIVDVAEQNVLSTTRTALADILWLAVAALFAGQGRGGERKGTEG